MLYLAGFFTSPSTETVQGEVRNFPELRDGSLLSVPNS